MLAGNNEGAGGNTDGQPQPAKAIQSSFFGCVKIDISPIQVVVCNLRSQGYQRSINKSNYFEHVSIAYTISY